MRFLKICKNKKVISLVLAIIVSLSTTILGHASSHVQENNKTEIELNNTTNKSIGIKTKRETKVVNNKKELKGKRMTVGATAYCGDTITSTGTVPKVGHTIAVDPNVIPYGSRVYIPEFNKVFIAEDCGSAIKGNRIDIFMENYSTCMEYGFKTITIYVLD